MKAYVLDTYRTAPRPTEIDEPPVGDSDVLVDVAAASVNPLDVKIGEGNLKQILPYRLPHPLGHDVAGTVRRIGPKVTEFAPGDDVYARVGDQNMGTFAERVTVAESDLAPAPAGLSPVEAASLPLVALTAWQALHEKGALQPGQRVLIHGGAGGVGSIAIQLAKTLGAHVATTASAANADLVHRLGADVVIDYRTEDFSTILSGYDLVLDTIGGQTLDKSLTVLRPGGRAVSIAGPPDPDFAAERGLNAVVRLAITLMSRRIRKDAKKAGVAYRYLYMRPSGRQLREITGLVERGDLRPLVGRVFPFDQTPQAMQAVADGGVPGKVVIAGPAATEKLVDDEERR